MLTTCNYSKHEVQGIAYDDGRLQVHNSQIKQQMVKVHEVCINSSLAAPVRCGAMHPSLRVTCMCPCIMYAAKKQPMQICIV